MHANPVLKARVVWRGLENVVLLGIPCKAYLLRFSVAQMMVPIVSVIKVPCHRVSTSLTAAPIVIHTKLIWTVGGLFMAIAPGSNSIDFRSDPGPM